MMDSILRSLPRLCVFLACIFFFSSSPVWSSNTNPTVTFRTNSTNTTNLAGQYFYLRLYSISGYTNQANRLIKITNFTTNTTNVTGFVYTNDLVTFRAAFTNPATSSNLGTTSGTNGLVFDPTNGILYGIPTNNFILSISNSGIQVISTNQTWIYTNIYNASNNVFITNLSSSTNSSTNTNTVTTNPAYRFVFQSNAVIVFTNTNMAVNATNNLPTTNSNGLTNTYKVLSGPAYITDSTNLLATNAGSILLQVAITPGTNGTNATWKAVTNTFVVLATNPLASNFGFVTNPASNPTTATSLVYKGSTPLVLSGVGTARVTFSLDRPAVGQFFVTNGYTNLQVLSGTGNLVVTATRSATSTSAVSTSSVSIALNRASNQITMGGVFSNANTATITNPNTNSLPLLGTASNGTVVFTTANTNLVRITNGTTLLLLTNGTSTVVASLTNVSTNNYYATNTVTNTLIVNWTNPAAPVFTSTNLQDGTQGVAFSYTLTATASNTNAFPVTYGATNLPAGLSFNNTNLISGTPTQPGQYRMQLTASNAGGVTTNILTSAIAPATAFSVTNLWTNYVALGTGTNTNGTYTFTSNLPAGIGWGTNSNASSPPVLVLSNTNTNTNTTNWFAGQTNLNVVFSNSQTNFTSSVTLNVLPGAPALSLATSVTGTPGLLLSLTGTVTPSALTNIPGYPLSFRSSNLPSGLTLNQTSGVVSGKPVYAGVTTSSIWGTNVAGTSTTSPVTFNVQAMAGAPVQLSVAFANGVGTYSVPNLPPGLTLTPSSGAVTGSPLAVGTFNLVVNFVPSGSATTNTTNQSLIILPPAPVPVVPDSNNAVTAYVGRSFTLQPWVTGPGWGWAGADPLTNSTINSSVWTNQLLVGTSSVVLSSNSNGVVVPGSNGLTFVSTTNTNNVELLWKSNLPTSWPWQAMLRLRVPGGFSNGSANPFLGVFPAQTTYSNNFYDLYSEGYLLASSSGVIPTAVFFRTNGTNSNNLVSVGTNEISFRMKFDTNLETLVVAANTNLNSITFTNLLTNTAVGSNWSVTNTVNALRIWLGSGFSNQAVSSNQILLRSFVVMPQGVKFSLSNQPSWLQCDPDTGTLYGTPTTNSSQVVYLYASNAQGTNFTGFRLRVVTP